MSTSAALECKAREVGREVQREGHGFMAKHSYWRRVQTGCTGQRSAAVRCWGGFTLCSVHCHLNGTLFTSRQRARKVTATHARMPLHSSGWRRGLFGSIRNSAETTRVRKLGFIIYCNVSGTV